MSSRRPASFLIRLAASLAGLLCLAFLAGAIIVHVHPRLLLDPVEKAVSEALPGSRFAASSARPSLWPSPGIVLHDAVLSLPDGNALFAESLECHLSWQAVFQRELSPVLLVLKDFNARLIWPGQPSGIQAKADGVWPHMPEALQGLKVQLRDGHLELLAAVPDDDTPPAAPLLDARDINGQLLLPAGTHPGSLRLQTDVLRQTLLDKTPIPVPHTLHQLDVRLDGLVAAPSAPLGMHLRGATVSLQGSPGNILEKLALQVQLAPQHTTALKGNVLFEAALRPKAWPDTASALLLNADLPFTLDGGLQWSLSVDDGRVALDDDSAHLTMVLHSDATASGTVRVNHLSLTRWFSFARALPDGLMTALDAMSGTLSFKADAHGVDVPELQATLAGHAFAGSASLTDFQHPVLQIKAATQMANLGRLLPELCGEQQTSPVFATPPLDARPENAVVQRSTQEAAAPSNPEDTGVSLSYDIRLRATDAQLGTLSGKGMSVTITPAPANPDTTRLTLGMDALYGGSASMTMDIADRCTVQLNGKNLDARMLDTLLPKGVTPRGTVNITASLSAPSDSVDTFMQQLAGTASMELLNGSLNVGGTRQAFSRLKLSTTGQVSRTETAGAATKEFWKGTWKLTARASSPSVPLAPLDATLTLDGETGFLSSPFTPLGGRQLRVRTAGTVLGGHTDCTATLDLTLPQGNITLRNLRGALAGCTVQGNAAASSLFNTPALTAQGTVSCSNLSPLLHYLGAPLPRPGASLPKSLSLSASLAFDRSTLRLDKLNGKLDGTAFQGSVSRSQNDLPHWDVTLHFDRLDLGPYLSPSGKDAAPGSPTARLLRSMTLSATLTAKELVLGEIPFQQVNANATLENGTLHVAPVSASCCGGPASAVLTATARQDDTTATNLQCSVSDVDLARLSSAADADVQLRGKARFETRLAGVFRTPEQAAAAQSGTWSLTFGAGSFTTLDPRTKRADSTYHIRSASASGTLKNEIIACNDLRIQGRDFSARGRGIINLRSNTLDYTINASIPGVPDIPIRYSGSLNDPTRRINAFRTLTSVFSNIGHHAFSLLKNIINVPFSLIN